MSKKEFGSAQYKALRLGRFVSVIAHGTLSAWNDRAYFEQLPFKIYPPIWGFFIEHADNGIQVTREFTTQQLMPMPDGFDVISIEDATGRHYVPIVTPAELAATFNKDGADDAGTQYSVYKRVDANLYAIYKSDEPVLAIYQYVFGPATLTECEVYVDQNQGV